MRYDTAIFCSTSIDEMTCALCLGQKPLLKSHIIPEFLYQALYDDKHRFHVLTTRADAKNRVEQKGARESLLCADCERAFSGFERYASLLFRGGLPTFGYKRQGDTLFLSGIDYRQFKLFQLSILWRASVSKLKFFQHVDLGPHTERLRLQLLRADPGPSNRYPCLMWGLRLNPGQAAAVMLPPERFKTDGKTHYVFVFGGYLWNFHVSKDPLAAQWCQLAIQENGSCCIQVKDVTEIPGLNKFMHELVRLGRAPQTP
jgi:hypothetical protein